MRYGPNSQEVLNLREELDSYCWFERIGSLHPNDSELVRVDFSYMVEHDGFRYAPWGSLLATQESQAEKLIFAHARIGAQNAMVADFSIEEIIPSSKVDDLLFDFDETYAPDGSYYPGTFTYPHEMIEFPDRLIRGAGLELVVADLDPSLTFFRDLLPWLQEGFWPVGWQGEWPEGRLMVW